VAIWRGIASASPRKRGEVKAVAICNRLAHN